jgi:hypothetical protein
MKSFVGMMKFFVSDVHIGMKQKPAKLTIETFDLARKVHDAKNNNEQKFLLTTESGLKLCAGSYEKCDAVWGKRLDHNHYTMAGVLWFIHEGQAYRMPGY